MMLPWSWIAAGIALLALLAGVAEGSRRWERAGWLEREAKAVQAAADARNESLRLANAAAARHEAARDRVAQRLPEALHATRSAMAEPADCRPGDALGDLVLGPGALRGVRDAASSAGDRPAATGPGLTVPRGSAGP